MSYSSKNVAENIKLVAKDKNLTLKNILNDCGLGINTISKLSKGATINFIALSLIADELDVSVDYLVGRTENRYSHKQ